MAFPFLTPIDMNKLEVLNAALQNLATPPSAPVEGQVYFDTALDQIGVYANATWVYLGSGSGTVTSVSVVSANGFAGSVANATSTPAITLTTTITGLLKGNGTAISAAAAGTDYLAPNGNGSALTGITVSQVSGAAPLASPTFTGTVSVPTASPGDNSTTAASTAFVTAAINVLSQGLDPKPGARVATAAALPACTYANGTSGVGATLTGNANGALTVDGYAVASGDIVLVKNQASGLQNGLYDVTQAGSGGTPFILTRNAAMDTAAEFSAAYIVVEDAGSTNANSFWVCTNSSDPTVGTTAITFSQLNGATQLIAGTGITISGNTISINTGYVGQTSITTLGTITTGVWNGTDIAVADGGTGASTPAGARTNLGAVGKYSALIGDGSSTSISITQATHGLAANGQMTAQVFDAVTGALVQPDITINNANGTVTFTFAVAPSSSAYRVVIMG